MIKINDKEYTDYSINIDYEFSFDYYDDEIEISGWWPLNKVNVMYRNTKKLVISPVFVITTKIGSPLYHFIDSKRSLMFDPKSGRIGLKKDYVFDFTFDDKFDENDSGHMNVLNSFLKEYETNVDNTVTFRLTSDYYDINDGVYEFMNYIGVFEVPKELNTNYIHYIKENKLARRSRF